jgi:hypothetical protein
MFGHLTKRTAAHSDDHIVNASRYVREGRRIPFD